MTNRTVILSDIRAEIGPYKTIDLERVASRESIDRSYDLKQSRDRKTISVVKHSIIRNTIKIPHITTPGITKDDIASVVKSVIQEHTIEKKTPSDEKTHITEESVKNIMHDGLDRLMSSIREQINSINISKTDMPIESNLSQSDMANLQQKAISKVSEEMETSNKPNKKIIIKNDRAKDIANEL